MESDNEIHPCDNCNEPAGLPPTDYADNLCAACQALSSTQVTCRKCGKVGNGIATHTCDSTRYVNGVEDAIAAVRSRDTHRNVMMHPSEVIDAIRKATGVDE